MRITPATKLRDVDVATIAEIAEAVATSELCRIKLFDKRVALDAPARHRSFIPLPPRRLEAPAS